MQIDFFLRIHLVIGVDVLHESTYAFHLFCFCLERSGEQAEEKEQGDQKEWMAFVHD